MARRRQPQVAPGDETPVMPYELVKKGGMTAAEFSAQCRAQRQWYLEHGIDPGDWRQVYPVLKASWKAHGIPSAEDRARLRSESRPDLVDDERRTR